MNRIRCYRFFLVSFIYVLIQSGTSRVTGETIAVPAFQDASIYESARGTRANGSGQRLFAGNTSFGLRRALVAFDVADHVPANATIHSAEVRFVADLQSPTGPSVQFELHRVTSDWREGPSVAPLIGGEGVAARQEDVTWIHRSFDDEFWENPGGDFAPSASSVATVSNLGSVVFTSTDQLVQDVVSWRNAPATNFGWVLSGGETTSLSARRFHSRESSIATSRPTLMVEFDLPQLLAGDVDGDGDVDLADFNVLKAHFGQSPAARDEGDLDDNGRVDLADFNLLKSNFGAVQEVPEPEAWVLCCCGVIGLLVASFHRL